jgi:hypothetical protein
VASSSSPVDLEMALRLGVEPSRVLLIANWLRAELSGVLSTWKWLRAKFSRPRSDFESSFLEFSRTRSDFGINFLWFSRPRHDFEASILKFSCHRCDFEPSILQFSWPRSESELSFFKQSELEVTSSRVFSRQAPAKYSFLEKHTPLQCFRSLKGPKKLKSSQQPQTHRATNEHFCIVISLCQAKPLDGCTFHMAGILWAMTPQPWRCNHRRSLTWLPWVLYCNRGPCKGFAIFQSDPGILLIDCRSHVPQSWNITCRPWPSQDVGK